MSNGVTIAVNRRPNGRRVSDAATMHQKYRVHVPPHRIDRARLTSLLAAERARFADTHPRSRAAFERGRRSLFGGVPMTWMNKAAGGFPLYVDTARGAAVRDIDGRDYVDFALGDTGAMA